MKLRAEYGARHYQQGRKEIDGGDQEQQKTAERAQLRREQVPQANGKGSQDEKVTPVGEEHVPFEEGRKADHREGVGRREKFQAVQPPTEIEPAPAVYQLRQRRHQGIADEEAGGDQESQHLVDIGLEAPAGRGVVAFEETILKQLEEKPEWPLVLHVASLPG